MSVFQFTEIHKPNYIHNMFISTKHCWYIFAEITVKKSIFQRKIKHSHMIKQI